MRGLRKTTAFYALDRSSLMTMTSFSCKMTFVKQSNASAHVKNEYLSTCGVWLRISTTKLLKLNARGTSFNGQRLLPSHLTARSRRKEESDFFLSFCVCAFGSLLMTSVIDCISDGPYTLIFISSTSPYPISSRLAQRRDVPSSLGHSSSHFHCVHHFCFSFSRASQVLLKVMTSWQRPLCIFLPVYHLVYLEPVILQLFIPQLGSIAVLA